jgi:hydroxymethylbilane synthase
MQRPLRIGTRGSKLALAQVALVRTALAHAHGWDRAMLDEATEIVVIRTSGDAATRPLSEIGGKGLFVKELEEALLRKQIHMAVHSIKDLMAVLPPGLVITATLPRENPSEAYLSSDGLPFASLSQGASVGTSSPRRRAQILRLRPDVNVVPFRGNVDTRLAKLKSGDVAATFLAFAGLKRLGLDNDISEIMNVEDMLPAIAQGAIGLQTRQDDVQTRSMLQPINDRTTQIAITLERAFLEVLEGDCRTPIAGLAQLAETEPLIFRGQVLLPDGSDMREVTRMDIISGDGLADAQRIGHDAGLELKRVAGSAYFAKT